MSKVLSGMGKIIVGGKVIAEGMIEITDKKFPPAVEIQPYSGPFEIHVTRTESGKDWQENLKKIFGDPMDLINAPKRIFFWAQKEEYGALSNFFPSPFSLDNRLWPTVEHYYQAMKTDNIQQQEEIRAAATPGKAKRMGAKVQLRSNWEDIKFDIMRVALLHKFNAHPELGKMLVATGNAEIYEDSPFDTIWGTGVRGQVGDGQNLLGKALMDVRDTMIRFGGSHDKANT